MRIFSGITDLFRRKINRAEQNTGTGKTELAASGAGVLLVLLILLIFILAATWLKAVFAGLLFAYLFLPFERLMENLLRFRLFRGLAILFLPLVKLKEFLMRGRQKKQYTQDQFHRKKVDSLTARAAGLTVFNVLLLAVVFLGITVGLLFPYAMEKGTQISHWAQESSVAKDLIRKLDQKLSLASDSVPAETAETAEASGTPETETKAAESLIVRARAVLMQWFDGADADSLYKGADIATRATAMISALGTFAFDLLLFVFFFFFFLQKMASYRLRICEEHGRSADDIGAWTVRSVLNSGWLPPFSREAQELAEQVLKRVFQMFDAWLGGYIAIILLESVLYCTVFLLFQVPYAIPLGLIAGLTILLPFLGPVASFLLTLTVTLIFAPAVTLPLVGICAAYLLINGLLEQFFLYPTLVGEAIGLSTLETIISVLAGGALAGISGMILAVPAAALLKLLVPLVYDAIKKYQLQKHAGKNESPAEEVSQ